MTDLTGNTSTTRIGSLRGVAIADRSPAMGGALDSAQRNARLEASACDEAFDVRSAAQSRLAATTSRAITMSVTCFIRFAAAQTGRFILREERSWLEDVPGTLNQSRQVAP